jgi:predicted DNA-binding protein (UPF0251 family)
LTMAATNHDKQAQHRTLEARYALDSPEGVRKLLTDVHALRIRRERGDYAASDILIDLERAIELADLTDRQRQALALIFERDLRQADAGKAMGVRQDTVSKLVKSALVKIAAVYEKWAWRGEGYALTRRHEVANEWGEARVVWTGAGDWIAYTLAVQVRIKHGKWRVLK